MKNIIFAVLSLMMFSLAFAYDKKVPGETLIGSLPEGSRLIVVKTFEWQHCNNNGCEIKLSAVKYGSDLSTYNTDRQAFQKGAVFPITKSGYMIPGETSHYWVSFGDSANSTAKRGRFSFAEWDKIPYTVAEFLNIAGKYVDLVYDDPDPYPGMEKSMVIDIVMAKISAGMIEKKYQNILPDFEFLEKQVVDLPERFYYYYTEALDKSGESTKARERASDYLKRYGKKGKYYQQAIEIMSRL